MATVSTLLKNPQAQKSAIAGAEVALPVHVAVASGLANSGDVVQLFTVPKGQFVAGFLLGHDATLGASCTLTFRVGTTTLSAATTAGAASQVGQTIADDPANATADRILNAVVGGANITAGANIVGYVKLASAT